MTSAQLHLFRMHGVCIFFFFAMILGEAEYQMQIVFCIAKLLKFSTRYFTSLSSPTKMSAVLPSHSNSCSSSYALKNALEGTWLRATAAWVLSFSHMALSTIYMLVVFTCLSPVFLFWTLQIPSYSCWTSLFTQKTLPTTTAKNLFSF